MPHPRNEARNNQIFEACLAGKSYTELAQELGLTATRIEQVFLAEVERRHPMLFASIPRTRGLRDRLIEALKAQGAAA